MAVVAGRARALKVLSRYDNLPHITEGGRTLDDWNDSMILNVSSLPLVVLDDNALIPMIESLVKGITSCVSEVIAYDVLQLTWNMRSELNAEIRIFPARTPQITGGKAADLSNNLSVPVGNPALITIPGEEEKERRAEFVRQGCFLAASLLKLFSKEPISWIKAVTHISDNYKKFTEIDFIFREIVPHEPSISALRRLFQTKMAFRYTLGNILYCLKPMTEGRGMTQMLFEQHLSYTGLHIVGLFCKACVGLRTDPGKLMNALHTSSFEPTLDQLSKILCEYMGSEVSGTDRETYKYARLYKSDMFSLLQTKHCPDLVCILGHIGQSCGNVGGGNVMEIAAIANLSPEAKEIYKKVAHNIFTYFKVAVPGAENDMYKTDAELRQ